MEYTKISKKMKSPVDGLELDLLILVPEEAPKGILQIHHGMAEYKERYLPFMKYFAEAGYVAAIHDCRGHGKSVRTKKDLGYMYGAGMDALIEDTAEVTRMLKEEWQGVPLILLGHSIPPDFLYTLNLRHLPYTPQYASSRSVFYITGNQFPVM